MKRHEAWLFKAENDLKSAKKLISGDEWISDTAVFHAQQCAEKALKAFLSYNRKPIQKTHDIAYLVELCVELDHGFQKFTEDAAVLTPLGTMFRYPDIVLLPDVPDVTDAIDRAERILSFVQEKLGG